MSKIYCGASNKIPNGKKRGSESQCAGQIRYYGIEKISSKLLKQLREKHYEPSFDTVHVNLLGKRMLVNSKIKKLKEKIDNAHGSELNKLQKELGHLMEKKGKYERETKALTNSRKKGGSRSRSTTKKSSRSTTKKSSRKI